MVYPKMEKDVNITFCFIFCSTYLSSISDLILNYFCLIDVPGKLYRVVLCRCRRVPRSGNNGTSAAVTVGDNSHAPEDENPVVNNTQSQSKMAASVAAVTYKFQVN